MIREAERVISGGSGNHAATALLGREQKQSVPRATFLEAASTLQILHLAENLHTGEFTQRDGW